MKTPKIIIAYFIGILAFCIYLHIDIIRIGLYLFFYNKEVNERALAIICPYILAAITMYLICTSWASFNNKEKLLLKISLLMGLFLSVFTCFLPYKYLDWYHFTDMFLLFILEYSIPSGLSLIIYAILNYLFKFNLKVSKEVNTITDKKRGVAMLFDIIPIFGALVLLILLSLIITIDNSIMNVSSLIIINSGLWFKDFFKGKSIGKLATGILVVDKKTLKPASTLRCIVRNLFLTIWFIEMFVWFFNPNSRRIGDYVAGTIVVQKDIDEF